MHRFILNSEDITTDQPPGGTVLDFVRYHKNLKGTKIGCREGDCGACTILVGEFKNGEVAYRTMTSCLMPLANAAGKHIVTIEGINPSDGSLTPLQRAMVDENGTQCGFCTVGFVMSLTGFCIDDTPKTPEMAVSSIDGNICRCTGYRSIARAAARLCDGSRPYKGGADAAPGGGRGGSLHSAIEQLIVPDYFTNIRERLAAIAGREEPPEGGTPRIFVGGGTDVYVQRPDAMAEAEASHILYNDALRGIRDLGHSIEIGASATVTDLLESPVMNAAFPDLYKHLKLVSSTPIRNMATIAGNFINASPIGDMTVWFLALNAEILLNSPPGLRRGADASSAGWSDSRLTRTILLKKLYLGYKQLAKEPEEYITAIRFKKPTADHYFNFEKVCKRTYLDIATVNTAILLKCESIPGQAWTPPALSGSGSPPYEGGVDARVFGEQTGWFSQDQEVSNSDELDNSPGRGEPPHQQKTLTPLLSKEGSRVEYNILDAHISAGGVAPIPLYLKETSSFLLGRTVNEETIEKANEIMQLEISPISDVRGTEEYKRLLLRQLFRAHFVELFDTNPL